MMRAARFCNLSIRSRFVEDVPDHVTDPYLSVYLSIGRLTHDVGGQIAEY